MLVGKRDRKRTLGKPKNGSEVKTKMDLTGAELDDMDYSYGSGARQRVDFHQKGNKPSSFIKCEEFLD
jgi:hypothetical protein